MSPGNKFVDLWMEAHARVLIQECFEKPADGNTCGGCHTEWLNACMKRAEERVLRPLIPEDVRWIDSLNGESKQELLYLLEKRRVWQEWNRAFRQRRLRATARSASPARLPEAGGHPYRSNTQEDFTEPPRGLLERLWGYLLLLFAQLRVLRKRSTEKSTRELPEENERAQDFSKLVS